jgi:hypothetical protein
MYLYEENVNTKNLMMCLHFYICKIKLDNIY